MVVKGRILANFKRGRGDYMGLAGNLKDNGSFCGPVRQYLPNDFGLYNMAGNVNEWTADTYRPMTSLTLNDAENQELNPYRGNQFQTLVIDEEGKILKIIEKVNTSGHSQQILEELGMA